MGGRPRRWVCWGRLCSGRGRDLGGYERAVAVEEGKCLSWDEASEAGLGIYLFTMSCLLRLKVWVQGGEETMQQQNSTEKYQSC